MATRSLLAHRSPDSVVAWSARGPVTRNQFLAEVMHLAARWPEGQHVLNLCADRYRFGVGLAAAIVSRKVSLLPPTHTPGVIRQVRDHAPDVICLTDNPDCTVDLPQLQFPSFQNVAPDELAIPEIGEDQCIAVLFTSGSTGAPKPHAKTWRSLTASVTAEARHFGLPPHVAYSVTGTVPPQHMFGFESTVLMPWQNGFALAHTHPFFPADIVAALEHVPAPRVLVSSPVHLRALLDAQLPLPDIALVVCATAPLSSELAQEVETRCNTRLMEIYGSTETGQVASRRTTQTAVWDLFPDVRLSRGDSGGARASGGHVETPVAMSDLIEPVGDTRFLLHGRLADMINIAGKRHSLASLNHLLNGIPGVTDGAFYMPDTPDTLLNGHVPRLAACVVAPDLDAPRVLAALREHLDPVFLPRPLLFVDALPRNNTGKLPREALQALFKSV